MSRIIANKSKSFTWILILSLLLLATTLTRYSAAQGIQLPAGFALKTVASGLMLPLDMEFLPNGDILVAEKGSGQGLDGVGTIRLVENGIVNPTPVISLSAYVFQDGGINALTVDRDFADNGYFYVWYSAGNSSKDWDGNRHVRLSRFTFDFTSKVADPASELILLKTSLGGSLHHGHAVHMDNEGYLYVAAGDSFTDGTISQDPAHLDGKLMRIRPMEDGYTIPADNPFVGVAGARPEIYALGLRNPYRMAFRESDQLLLLGDVGSGFYEEANRVVSGANYGWPLREGPCLRGTADCVPNAAYYDPYFFYPHESVGHAITGLTFYEGSDFPAEYHDKLFFADFNKQRIGVMQGQSQYDIFLSGGAIVDLAYHGGSIYAINIEHGRIDRIYFTGADNVLPAADIIADQRYGQPPMHVTFSADVTDPDDTLFTYEWDAGDGSQTTLSNQPTFSHTYTTQGVYTARLIVTDGRGGQSLPAEITINAYDGEFAIIDLEIADNPARTNYDAGDTIIYSAERTSLDGLDPQTPYTWRIDFHHNDHIHPFINNHDVISNTVTVPTDNHDGDYLLWYEFVLTMNTTDIGAIEIHREIFPRLANLTFETMPSDGKIYLNGVETATPHTLTAVVGIENRAVANPTIVFGQGIYTPRYWEYGQSIENGDSLHLFTPATDQAYRAVYQYEQPAELQFIPFIRR